MKVRDSGMPDEAMWQTFFDPGAVLDQLGLQSIPGDVVEFGCGYGTFTVAAARAATGKVYAIDIEPEMIDRTARACRDAGAHNVEIDCRDFVREGTGLPDASVAAALLFNILHCEEPVALLKEARRVLMPEGKAAVIHWRSDIPTPRGPSLDIRPRPEQCRLWAETAGLASSSRGVVTLPPYHFGLVFSRS